MPPTGPRLADYAALSPQSRHESPLGAQSNQRSPRDMNAKSNRKGGRHSGGSKPRRPYSTIDLKATEVSAADVRAKDESAKQDAGKDAGRSAAKPQSPTAKSDLTSRPGAQPASKSASASGSSSDKAPPEVPPEASSGQSSADQASSARKSSAAGKSSAVSTAAAGADKPSAGKPSNAGASVPVMGAGAAEKSGARTGDKQTTGKQAAGKTTGPASSARTSRNAGLAGSTGGGHRDGTGGNNGTAVPGKAKSNSGGGFLSHMSAGILGALLAFFGATYASNYANIPGLSAILPSRPPVASLPAAADKRIAALEKALAARPRSDANASAALKQKLAALQRRLGTLDGMNKAIAELKAAQTKLRHETGTLQKKLTKSGTGSEITGRIAQLEQTLAALGAAAKSNPDKAGRIPQLAAISGRLNDLETALKTRFAALRKDVVQEIDSRVAATSQASESAKSGTQRLDRDVNALRSAAAKMDQRLVDLAAANKQTAESLRVVQQAGGNLKARVDSLKADFAAKFKATAKPADLTAAIAPMAKRLSSLEQNVKGVVQSEAGRKSNARRIVLALELGNLKRAMDRGQSFAAELAQVERVAAGKLDLSALQEHKSDGVPTLSNLQNGFRSIAFKIIDRANLKDNASVVDQLLRSAKSMVRIRKINHNPDDAGAEAIVGRMDVALKDGRLSDVIAEAARLPKKALVPAQDWLDKVKARQSVDKAIADIEASLKSSLSGKSTGEKG